jgi:hypothetical protein
MSRKFLAIALAIVLTASLVGCQTESGYYSPEGSTAAGALGGAATGAALGAIIGAATGSPATGAWVGAAAGGLLGGVGGYLYAQHRNSEIQSSQAAAQTYNYTPAQGNVVAIDSVTATPPAVSAGQQENLAVTYTILTPANAPVSITLVREVRLGGQMLGQPYQTTVTNANGTFSDSVAYTLPSNATPGTYTVTTRVTSSYGSDQKEAFFTVQ